MVVRASGSGRGRRDDGGGGGSNSRMRSGRGGGAPAAWRRTRCVDFTRGCCTRGASCKFWHGPVPDENRAPAPRTPRRSRSPPRSPPRSPSPTGKRDSSFPPEFPPALARPGGHGQPSAVAGAGALQPPSIPAPPTPPRPAQSASRPVLQPAHLATARWPGGLTQLLGPIAPPTCRASQSPCPLNRPHQPIHPAGRPSHPGPVTKPACRPAQPPSPLCHPGRPAAP